MTLCRIHVYRRSSQRFYGGRVNREPRTYDNPFPIGPAWWGGVMGTGIVSTLTQLHVGHTAVGSFLARAFLIAAWGVMTAFTVGFVTRCRREPGTFYASRHGVGSSAWGMVSMGVLSVGSATQTVIPAWNPDLTYLALGVDAVLWIVGTVLGIRTAFGFAFGLLRYRPEEPRPAWGLAVVPPMVTAPTGTAFVDHLPSTAAAFTLVTFLTACFALSLTLAMIIFYAAYNHHIRAEKIPTQAAISSWIPLGPVGQSTAAAQVISSKAEHFLVPEAVPMAYSFANWYGIIALAVAVPLVGFAIYTSVRAAFNGLRFSPGFWALTFPVGTLSLGSYYLATSIPLYGPISVAIWLSLLGTWTLCATLSAKHWMKVLTPQPVPADLVGATMGS